MGKFLFLDVDGVLNKYPHDLDDYNPKIDINLLDLFAKLIEETGAKIILSSDWKYDFTDELEAEEDEFELFDGRQRVKIQTRARVLLDYFSLYGLKLTDKTPRPERTSRYDWIWSRPDEISKYIDTHFTEDDVYVIVDDNDDGLKDRFGDKFVQTHPLEGLRTKDCDKIKEILGCDNDEINN